MGKTVWVKGLVTENCNVCICGNSAFYTKCGYRYFWQMPPKVTLSSVFSCFTITCTLTVTVILQHGLFCQVILWWVFRILMGFISSVSGTSGVQCWYTVELYNIEYVVLNSIVLFVELILWFWSTLEIPNSSMFFCIVRSEGLCWDWCNQGSLEGC